MKRAIIVYLLNVKKSYEPSSSSSSSRRSSNRSVLMPVEEEALSEYINSSPVETLQSSVPSDRTIEYVDEATPPISVVSSRRSQETIEYIRSRSSRGSARSIRKLKKNILKENLALIYKIVYDMLSNGQRKENRH